MVLRIPLGCFGVSPTWLSHAPVDLPMSFGYTFAIPQRGPYPVNITTYGFAFSAFARHYSRNLGWFLFLSLLRCFSSGGSPRNAMDSRYALWLFTIGVSPFGNPRIEAYLQLPVAYRSLSRPSSAPDAKAFALCSLSLELSKIFLAVLSLNCLSFINKFLSGSILQLKVFLYLLWILFHLSVKLYLPFFGKTKFIFDYC